MKNSHRKVPFHIMVKPIGAQCNLRCDYCFYLEKTSLYARERASEFRMSEQTLETLIRRQIEATPAKQKEIQFAWQGGEPTLMGMAFFEKVEALQRKYAPKNLRISNTLQTNGVLITDDFARFMHDHEFLVGVSVDGPKFLHDKFRHTISGEGSFDAVMKGVEKLHRHRVEYNILTVVNSDNGNHPEEVYRSVAALGSPFLQFIPLVERDSQTVAGSRSVGADQWGGFLTRLFHLWRARDIGHVYVQHFDMLLGLTMGFPASLCVHAPKCGRALALEHNGDLYSCDHFVDREHFLGNISSNALGALINSPLQLAFRENKSASLPSICKQCEFLRMCNGGCPKDRLISTESGMLNWLCSGYKSFYRDTAPYFGAMARSLRAGSTARDYERFLHG